MHETFPDDVDLIVRGAVYTMDVARPVAEAFAVRDGKVAAVGDEADVMALAGPRTRVTHSGDGMVMPGIVDRCLVEQGVQFAARKLRSVYTRALEMAGWVLLNKGHVAFSGAPSTLEEGEVLGRYLAG